MFMLWKHYRYLNKANNCFALVLATGEQGLVFYYDGHIRYERLGVPVLFFEPTKEQWEEYINS